jgi:hypothetical protein
MQSGHITARANPLILASVTLVAGGVDGSEAALVTDRDPAHHFFVV